MTQKKTPLDYLRILVACEESQIVTNQFRLQGFKAFSCDILPTSGMNPEWHIQEDLKKVLDEEWDVIIAFPPCTNLANSGARWFKEKKESGIQQESIDFFMSIANHKAPHIAIENPVGIMSSRWRKPDQIIQPFQFGDPVKKTTCLWLKSLPLLVQNSIIYYPNEIVEFKSGKRMSKWYYETSLLSKEQRGQIRSKTFPGIANAMATQWGQYLKEQYNDR